MYKYEIVGKEIIDLLKQQKKAGEKTVVLNALEIDKELHVSERCGDTTGHRSPLICQAMVYATEKYPGEWIAGKNPSTTFTVEYKVNK